MRVISILLVLAVAGEARAQVGVGWLRNALAPPRAGMRSVPSDAIYPPQKITLRFSHAVHRAADVDCLMCHDAIKTSSLPSDRNIPNHEQCSSCHDIEEAAAGEEVDPPSSCRHCHPGHEGPTGEPPPSHFPPANIKFSHELHLAKGARCVDCHANVEKVDLATRADLPSMMTCLGCHDGQAAPNRCQTCHVTQPDGVLVTRFASGTLAPSGTLADDDHGRDFLRRHANIARSEMESCSSCHRTAECETCHASSSKAFRVHPPDWFTTHAVSARGQEMDCQSCHRQQEFCLSCHQQIGVARESRLRQPGTALASQRFHPAGFSNLIADTPNHHAFQAQANLQSCVGCHTEQTCMQCHAVTGTVANVSPHPVGFRESGAACRGFRQAPVACAKCHGGGNGLLSLGRLLVGCN